MNSGSPWLHSVPATDCVALWRLTQNKRLKMPQQPLAAGVSLSAAVVVAVPVVALLLAQQRADMVIRLALWRVWRLTSISMVRNKKLLPTFLRAVLICEMFLLVYRYCRSCRCCCCSWCFFAAIKAEFTTVSFAFLYANRQPEVWDSFILCVFISPFLTVTENSRELWQVVQ